MSALRHKVAAAPPALVVGGAGDPDEAGRGEARLVATREQPAVGALGPGGPGAARPFLDLTKPGMLLPVRGPERQTIRGPAERAMVAQAGRPVPEREAVGAGAPSGSLAGRAVDGPPSSTTPLAS
jgi:hypothetical protein